MGRSEDCARRLLKIAVDGIVGARSRNLITAHLVVLALSELDRGGSAPGEVDLGIVDARTGHITLLLDVSLVGLKEGGGVGFEDD